MIALLAAILAIPSLLIVAQDDESLSAAKNMQLAPWPSARAHNASPNAYLRHASAWVKDRLGLGITSAGLVRWVKMYLLADDPAPQLTVNGDYLFLNAPTPETRFIFFRQACRPAKKASLTSLARDIQTVETYFRSIGVANTRFIVVPTTPVVHAEMLPTSVPSRIRRNCAAAAEGRSFTQAWTEKAAENALYPRTEFIKRGHATEFYPARSFHAIGEPNWLIAKLYFDKYRMPVSWGKVARGTIKLESEFSRHLGFVLPITAGTVLYNDKALKVSPLPPENPNFERSFLRLYGPGTDYGYVQNSASPTRDTVLVLSNSFGTRMRNHLAMGYNALFHVNITQTAGRATLSKSFYDFLIMAIRPKHVIIVGHDGDAAEMISEIGRTIREGSGRNYAPGRGNVAIGQ
jgi:hypothetical protein